MAMNNLAKPGVAVAFGGLFFFAGCPRHLLFHLLRGMMHTSRVGPYLPFS